MPRPPAALLALLGAACLLLSPRALLAATSCAAAGFNASSAAAACPVGNTSVGAAAGATCSNRGTCVLGACACEAGWISTDCSVADRPLILGDLAISQQALVDAPLQYSSLFQTLYQNMLASFTGIPAFTKTDNCTIYVARTPRIPPANVSLRLDFSTIAFEIVSDGILASATVNFNASFIPADVYVSSFPGINPGCCTSLFSSSNTCQPACVSSQGDHVSVSFNLSLAVLVQPVIWPNGSITATAPQITTNFFPSDLGFAQYCSSFTLYTSIIYNLVNTYVQPWGQTLADMTRSILVLQIQNQVSNSAAPQTYNLTSAISVAVQFSGIKFVAGQYIILSAQGNLYKQRWVSPLCPQVKSSFADLEPDRLAPVSQTWTKDLSEQTLGEPSETLALLAGLRLSRSFLRGLIWAWFLNDTSDPVAMHLSQTVNLMDAKFNINLDLGAPSIGFPASQSAGGAQQMDFFVESGSIDAVCENLGIPMMQAQFADVIAATQLVIIHSFLQPSQFSVAAQLETVDMSNINLNLTLPTFPVPNALMQQLVSTVLFTQLTAINSFLASKAVAVPSFLTQALPYARIDLVHENYVVDEGDGLSGYMQLTSRCLCGDTGTQGTALVPTWSHGNETVPLCVQACLPYITNGTTGRRSLHYSVDAISSTNPTKQHLVLQQRILTTSASSACNSSILASALPVFLNCLSPEATFPLVPALGRWLCMTTYQSSSLYPLGACSATHPFSAVASCSDTLEQAIPLSMNISCNASSSSGYECQETVSAVYQEACTCAVASTLCESWGIPLLFSVFGAIVSLASAITLFFAVHWWVPDDLREAMFQRQRMSDRDRFVIVILAILQIASWSSVVIWLVNDPFHNWLQLVLGQPLFADNSWVDATSLSIFMSAWSLAGVTILTNGSTSMTLVLIWTCWIGRVPWLLPTGMVQSTENEVLLSPKALNSLVFTSKIWLNSVRMQIFLMVLVIWTPQIFFNFISSVQLRPPSLNAAQLSAEDTVILDNPGLLSEMQWIIGLSVLSRAIGFISSAFLFMIHGVCPGMILATQVVLLILDGREAKARDLQRTHALVLPPASEENSDLNRVKKVLQLFMWSIHGAGGLSTMVPVIVLYQTLNAPQAWVVSWLLCWVLSTPVLLFLSNRDWMATTTHPRLKASALYLACFGSFTVALIALNPPGAAFSFWFGGAVSVEFGTVAFLLTMCELINVDRSTMLSALPKTEDMRAKKVRLMEHIGIGDASLMEIDLTTTVSPSLMQLSTSPLPTKRSPRGTATVQNASTPGSSQSPNMASLNPMFSGPVNAPGRPVRDEARLAKLSAAVLSTRPKVENSSHDAALLESAAVRLARRSTAITGNTPSLPGLPTTAPLVMAMARKREATVRDVEKKLVLRGVTKDQANRMAIRIVDFNEARNLAVAQQAEALRRSTAVALRPQRPPRPANLPPPTSIVNQLETARMQALASKPKSSPSAPLSSKKAGESGGAPSPVKLFLEKGKRPKWSKVVDNVVPKSVAMFFKWFWAQFYDFVFEMREGIEPQIYGLRLPYRRILFVVGCTLFLGVLCHNAQKGPMSAEEIKREIFGTLFGQKLLIPVDSDATNVLNGALSVYAEKYNTATQLQWVLWAFLCFACASEILFSRFAALENKKTGMRLSRATLFACIPIVFAMVLLTPSPDYFSELLIASQGIPQCAPKLNDAIASLVQSALGMGVGVYLCGQLALVLVVAVPSLMHGCYFITFREVRRLRRLAIFERREEYEMHFKRAANSRLCFRLYPLLNPVVTYVPLLVVCQLLSSPAVPYLCFVFWLWPMAFAHWGQQSKSEEIFFRQYFYYWILFNISYVAPLIAMIATEAGPAGILTQLVYTTFQNVFWYMDAFVVNTLIVIVLTDVLYLFLAARSDKDVGDALIDDYARAVEAEANAHLDV